MKFKIDENLPIEVSQRLQQAGHDAVTVLDRQLGGADEAGYSQISFRSRAFCTFPSAFRGKSSTKTTHRGTL